MPVKWFYACTVKQWVTEAATNVILLSNLSLKLSKRTGTAFCLTIPLTQENHFYANARRLTLTLSARSSVNLVISVADRRRLSS